ncbi:hypothetical protein STAFG_4223 [Streptomyces afghaniensis 772]|uniref:Uncharacterized protein n=1 Tax=Streptomyces afghaniensis 772 TaxID=1283301 RepID=S4NK06_9ACTN|nr:hypothetical protein STAFG_4223 [Streptomyces afghaniensis 772]
MRRSWVTNSSSQELLVEFMTWAETWAGTLGQS